MNRNLIDKIKKFANVDTIYKFSHDLDDNLSLWVSDKIVKSLKDIPNLSIVDYLKGNKNIEIDNITKSIISILSPKFNEVLDYVNSDRHLTKPSIKFLTLDEAVAKSREWHDEIAKLDLKEIDDEKGEILMTFKNGYYWIDLQTKNCKDEGGAMGHCGNTSMGTTLLSLRYKKRPFVTIAYNQRSNSFTQIKGRGNTKPIEKYHEYIVDLIIELKIIGYVSEYRSETDFTVDDLSPILYKKLQNENNDYIENVIATLQYYLDSNYTKEEQINLTYLNCSDSDLTSLKGIEKLINLTTLTCTYNNLTSLKGIEKLINLTKLECSHNDLTSLKGIKNLINLTELSCYDNKNLTSLKGIEKLINLTTLTCSHNPNLTSLKGIEKLINLTTLTCSNNPNLTSLKGIENLINLTELRCYNNPNLKSLKGIENLINLNILSCYCNYNLTSLKGIENLINLTYLDCSINPNLTSLKGIENLIKLTELNCSYNANLTSLKSIENLINLTVLRCYNNPNLTSIKGIEKLINLNYLNYHNNPKLPKHYYLYNLVKLRNQLKEE